MMRKCKWMRWCRIVAPAFFLSVLPIPAATELLTNTTVEVSLLDDSGKPVEWEDSVDISKTDQYAYRVVFEVGNVSEYVSLSLDQPEAVTALELNGKSVSFPLEGMQYKTVPGIPPGFLKEGGNILIATATISKKEKRRWARQPDEQRIRLAKDAGFSLKGLDVSDLALQTGPVLGCAGPTSITLACRVNMPADVQLAIGEHTLVSSAGLMHTFEVKGLKASTDYAYCLKGRIPGSSIWKDLSAPYSVRTFPADGGKLKFVAMGDSRTYPEKWSKVAAAAMAKKPMFCVFSGDMVTFGLRDYLWDYEVFTPAKEFFATIPFYAIIGNHENRSPLFNRVFPTPSGTKTWEQKIGSVHFIAVDGADNWSKGSKNIKWLETVLANSDAKFIFLYSHFPPWTSGRHGVLEKGVPKERAVREIQQVIMPLLGKYKATAVVAGHDHNYERSETPENVTVIVSGGAGAGLRPKVEESEKQNPYSSVFASEHHYCLFSVEGNKCTMTVYTPEGKVLDTRTWNARAVE